MISKILDETDPDMLICLLNTICFKATWTYKFNPEHTTDQTFTKEDGTTLKLPLMHRHANVMWAHYNNFTSICLPYSSGAFQMFLFLPDEYVTTKQVLDKLNADSFEQMKVEMYPKNTDVRIPRFTTTVNDLDLKKSLKKMGVIDAFTTDAQFPYITNQNVYVSLIKQAAKIIVNEEGTEAAAVTVAGDTATGESTDFIANPSGTDEQVRTWSAKLNEIMHSDVYTGYFAPFDARLMVGQMRGKILVFSRQKYNDVPVGAFCQNWSSSHLMEEQKAGSIVNAKWVKSPLWVQRERLSGEFFNNAVQDMMKAAVGRDMSADLPAWVFNFVSFKVTGDCSNNIRAYAEMRNIKAFNFLNNDYNIGPVGIVLMDFAGVDNTRDYYGQTCYASNGMQLVNALIRQNFKQ